MVHFFSWHLLPWKIAFPFPPSLLYLDIYLMWWTDSVVDSMMPPGIHCLIWPLPFGCAWVLLLTNRIQKRLSYMTTLHKTVTVLLGEYSSFAGLTETSCRAERNTWRRARGCSPVDSQLESEAFSLAACKKLNQPTATWPWKRSPYTIEPQMRWQSW